MDGENVGAKSDLNRRTNPAAFFRGFLREPRQVGSIIPSSRFLEQRIVEVSNLTTARRVVELGPGTGGTTQTFLRHLGEDARLLAIELSPYFHDLLGEISDPASLITLVAPRILQTYWRNTIWNNRMW